MHDAQIQALAFRAIDNLEQAARIAGGDDLRAGGLDVPELSCEKFVRHFRLDKVINASAPATPAAFRQLNQFQVWDRPQQLPWLRRDLLSVAKMAGFVIGDGLPGLVPARRLDAD